mgnify:CR=1 FL=1
MSDTNNFYKDLVPGEVKDNKMSDKEARQREVERLKKRIAELQEEDGDKKALRLKGVTVVVTAYNAAKTIGETITSLQAQTYPPAQIIIVDDGSTDDTLAVVQRFCEKSKIPIWVKTIENSWVYKARNIGALREDTMRGEYLMFLDSDDMIHPGYIERATKLLDNDPTLDIVYTDETVFNESVSDGKIVPTIDALEDSRREYAALLQVNYIPYCAVMRYGLFEDIGGYTEVLNDHRNHMCEWKLWWDAIRRRARIMKVNEPWFYYRQSPDQMSKHFIRDRFDQLLEMAFLSKASDHYLGTVVINSGVREGRIILVKMRDQDVVKLAEPLEDVQNLGLCLCMFSAPQEEKYRHILKDGDGFKIYELDFTDEYMDPKTQVRRLRTELFYEDKFDKKRVQYPDLNSRSMVWDAGGYRGDWASAIYRATGANIFIFEPVEDYVLTICNRFENHGEKVQVFNFGIWDKNVNHDVYGADDGVTMFGPEGVPGTKLPFRDIRTVMDELLDPGGTIDLLKLNIEGAEYNVIEALIDSGKINQIKHLQVQFHDFHTGDRKRRQAIQKKLAQSHTLMWNLDFVFESWSHKAASGEGSQPVKE